MKKASKTIAEKQHAMGRFAERFGKILTAKDYKEAVNNIQAQKYEFVARQSCRVTLWRGEVMGVRCLMVYDKLRNRIVTFLPEEESLCCPFLLTANCRDTNKHRQFVCERTGGVISNNQILDCCMFLWHKTCVQWQENDVSEAN